MLVDRVKVDTEPFTLTYHLEPEAKWSDGVPDHSDDLLFTLETLRNPANTVSSRAGYIQIVQAVKVDDKTARFVFDRPFPAWKSLFPQVLPKHALEGEDFNTVWNARILDPAHRWPIGSGPFLITEWLHGTSLGALAQLRLVGLAAPPLDAASFASSRAPAAQVQALLAGELSAIHPSPDASLAPLQGAPGIAFASSPGLLMEHLDLNTGSAAMPLLRETWFREAVAYALDRNTAPNAGGR